MFGGMAFKVGMLAKKSTGGGSDVTCTTDFTEYVGLAAPDVDSSSKLIAGINTTITLRLSQVASDGGDLYYIKNGGSAILISPDGGTFSVVNGDTIYFRWIANTWGVVIFDVLNESDSDADLGEITLDKIFD
jgi:hypothetical protein